MQRSPSAELPDELSRPDPALNPSLHDLSIDLLRSYAQNHYDGIAALPAVTGLVALVGTNWVPWQVATIWYAAVLISVLICRRTLENFLESDTQVEELAGWKRRIAAVRVLNLTTWACCAGAVLLSDAPALTYLIVALLGFPLFTHAMASAPWHRVFYLEALPLAAGGLGVILVHGGEETASLTVMALGFIGFCIFFSSRVHEESVRRATLERELLNARDDAETARSHLEHLATTDELTGIFNRRAFLERAENEIWRAQRYGHPVSLLMLDVDHFKNVNDKYGHAAGDATLQAVAGSLLRLLRRTDVLARWGGEEFVIVLPETEDDIALKVAERLRQTVSQLDLECNDHTFEVTVSIGVASLGDTGSVPALLNAADRALYLAKNQGRNRIVSAGVDARAYANIEDLLDKTAEGS